MRGKFKRFNTLQNSFTLIIRLLYKISDVGVIKKLIIYNIYLIVFPVRIRGFIFRGLIILAPS